MGQKLGAVPPFLGRGSWEADTARVGQLCPLCMVFAL